VQQCGPAVTLGHSCTDVVTMMVEAQWCPGLVARAWEVACSLSNKYWFGIGVGSITWGCPKWCLVPKCGLVSWVAKPLKGQSRSF
jgi:hypothetical protein